MAHDDVHKELLEKSLVDDKLCDLGLTVYSDDIARQHVLPAGGDNKAGIHRMMATSDSFSAQELGALGYVQRHKEEDQAQPPRRRLLGDHTPLHEGARVTMGVAGKVATYFGLKLYGNGEHWTKVKAPCMAPVGACMAATIRCGTRRCRAASCA